MSNPYVLVLPTLAFLAGCGGQATCFADADGDGYGYPNSSLSGASSQSTCVESPGDCDDADASVNPGAQELCDGIDNDCDGQVDQGLSFQDWYPDLDDDGWGSEEGARSFCQEPGDGWVPQAGDCDDGDPDIHPNAEETCNGLDDDCNGLVDDYIAGLFTDADGDGWGSNVAKNCEGPASKLDGDCDDGDPDIHPSAEETCNGLDDDCDGLVDLEDPDLIDYMFAYPDADGDGYGAQEAEATAICGYDLGDGYSYRGGDCDDTDPDVWPGWGYQDLDCDGWPGVNVEQAWAVVRGHTENSRLGDYNSIVVQDIDGDSVNDLVLGAGVGDEPGYVYIMDGSTLTGGGVFSTASAAFTMVGEDEGDLAGSAIVTMSDMDGDGLDELVLGTGSVSENAAYVVLSSQVDFLDDIELHLADAHAILRGPEDRVGFTSEMSAGDLDADSLDELVATAEHSDENGTWSGKAYVFFGADLREGGEQDTTLARAEITGEQSYMLLGSSCSAQGDVDGDGLADLLLGASAYDGDYLDEDNEYNYGMVCLFLGSTLSDGGSFSSSDADAILVGEEERLNAGSAVSLAMDLDGDGLADPVIGAEGTSYHAADTLERVSILLSSQIAWGRTEGLSTAWATWYGEESSSFGLSLAAAGDVDGDGLDDILVGAPHFTEDFHYEPGDQAEPHGFEGRTYVLLADSMSGGGTFSAAHADGIFGVGRVPAACSGAGLAGLGDMDGDDLDDIAIGAKGVDIPMQGAGSVYLFLSPY